MRLNAAPGPLNHTMLPVHINLYVHVTPCVAVEQILATRVPFAMFLVCVHARLPVCDLCIAMHARKDAFRTFIIMVLVPKESTTHQLIDVIYVINRVSGVGVVSPCRAADVAIRVFGAKPVV